MRLLLDFGAPYGRLCLTTKRKRPKPRAGCLLCKPSKLNAHKTADRMKARRGWRRDWDENSY